MSDIPNGLASFPLLTALLERRSRRFGAGFRLNGGPLAFESQRAPAPLSTAEEAALAFAANGVNGYALSELPFDTGDRPNAGGGHIMVHFVGRTVPSGDAMHLTTLFVVNDEGAWMLRRPQDFPWDQVPGLVELARTGRLQELYERSRVRIADRRVDVPRALPYLAPFNTWSANVTGSTYFVPIAELTVLYINVLLSFFDEEWSFFFVDDHNGYQPAGIATFGRSRGGHLHDDPRDGRVGTAGEPFATAWRPRRGRMDGRSRRGSPPIPTRRSRRRSRTAPTSTSGTAGFRPRAAPSRTSWPSRPITSIPTSTRATIAPTP